MVGFEIILFYFMLTYNELTIQFIVKILWYFFSKKKNQRVNIVLAMDGTWNLELGTWKD